MNNKKIFDPSDIKIVSANEKIVYDSSVLMMLAYASKKLDVDSAYIYTTLYSSLFPNVSKVAFIGNDAVSYVAGISTNYYTNSFFNRRKHLVFFKQWAVLEEFSFKNCEVNDENNSIILYLLNNIYNDCYADCYAVTINDNNTSSIKLAKRFAKSIGFRIQCVGYLLCKDYVYKKFSKRDKDLVDTSEVEKCYIIAKDPKKEFKRIKKSGLMNNIKRNIDM